MKIQWCSVLINVVLMCGALLLALTGAELLLRFAIPSAGNQFSGTYSVHEMSDNMKLLYRLRKDTVNDAHGVMNRVNHDGFRDRDYVMEKGAGVKRIIFLGDSVIYGYGLELENTIPKEMENAFSRKDRRVEVLNFGVSGYESEQEIEFLKEKGLKYKPDMVLVAYNLNDSRYASLELDKLSELPGNHVYATGANPLKNFLTYLYDHSRLLSFIDERLQIQKKVKELRSYRAPIRRYIEDKNRATRDPKDSEYRQLEKSVVEDAAKMGTSEAGLQGMLEMSGLKTAYDIGDSHWNISRKAFLELKELSRQHQFDVLIVVFPYFRELDKYALTSVHRYVDQQFSDMGFKVIDVLDFSKKLYLQYGDKISSDFIHMTPLGSRLMAEYLEEEIEKGNNFLPSSEKNSKTLTAGR